MHYFLTQFKNNINTPNTSILDVIKSFLLFLYNISIYFLFSQGWLLLFFLGLSFVRVDAEFYILCSVFLVFLTAWNILSDSLGRFLTIQSNFYYFYFLRVFQAKLWFIYNTSFFFNNRLFNRNLPFALEFNSSLKNNLNLVFGKNSILLWSKLDVLLNFLSNRTLNNIVLSVWSLVYNYNISLFNNQSQNDLLIEGDIKKLQEYVLVNFK